MLGIFSCEYFPSTFKLTIHIFCPLKKLFELLVNCEIRYVFLKPFFFDRYFAKHFAQFVACIFIYECLLKAHILT